MREREAIAATAGQIVRQELPNLLRLYLNPHVAQACFCLDRYVQTTWEQAIGAGPYPSFLANSLDEAVSGAVKLARYAQGQAGRPTAGLVLDPAGRLGPFVEAAAGGGRVVFVPGLTVAQDGLALDAARATAATFGFVVLVPAPGAGLEPHAAAIRAALDPGTLLVTCLDRATLDALRRRRAGVLHELPPDIVVFDESFVGRAVPFAAFAARAALRAHWDRPGKTTFHSTTYQPNTISTLHFLRQLAQDDPEFHARHAAALAAIASDVAARRHAFGTLYSPSLGRTIRMAGVEAADVRAAGDFVRIDGRPVFDAVSGVACSIRGHNPPSYPAELVAAPADAAARLADRLHALTGLRHALPAVSGASAVESALRLALTAQYPRRHILALKAGFGGKTLLALAGTANPAYKEHLDPLYPDAVYVDPFAPDAAAQLDAVLRAHPVAVVLVELIQAVGGVRAIPEPLLRRLADARPEHGYLLAVDEVQTGMYRTGPFSRARALGLAPDVLLLGKGTSDMMFTYALVLYGEAVHDRLTRAGSDLPAVLRRRHGYDAGDATVLNVLEQGERLGLEARVAEASARLARRLSEGLAGCPAVRAVRVYGLLVGIELEDRGWPRRWLRKRLYSFYVYALLRHRGFPVLAGFCQYEPNVLKLTPSLTAAPEDLERAAATIIDVLHRPFVRLLTGVLGGLARARWRPAQPARPGAAPPVVRPNPVAEECP